MYTQANKYRCKNDFYTFILSDLDPTFWPKICSPDTRLNSVSMKFSFYGFPISRQSKARDEQSDRVQRFMRPAREGHICLVTAICTLTSATSISVKTDSNSTYFHLLLRTTSSEKPNFRKKLRAELSAWTTTASYLPTTDTSFTCYECTITDMSFTCYECTITDMSFNFCHRHCQRTTRDTSFTCYECTITDVSFTCYECTI